MATRGRRRNLLNSRRRIEDDGEEDDGIEDLGDDSQSEASVLTADDAPGADESDVSEIDRSDAVRVDSKVSGAGPAVRDTAAHLIATPEAPATNGEALHKAKTGVFVSTADVETMVNGMKLDKDVAEAEAVDFEDATVDARPPAVIESNTQTATTLQGRLASARHPHAQPRINGRGQPDGRQKNKIAVAGSSTPSVRQTTGSLPQLPSTGASGGARVAGRGRDLGSNGVRQNQRSMPPFAPTNSAKWDHDLHESILQPSATQQPQPASSVQAGISQTTKGGSLSRTIPLGNAQARIFLPFMAQPIVLEKKILIRQHTRLPDLRPPLRRDKPVRISLPNTAPKYIFPTLERSFIFIPRAQRPNQQGKTRGRGGYMSRGGSRRTSVYGGSGYSPNGAVSRRSSTARDGMMSPQSSMFGRPPAGVPTAPSRPIVRFPGPLYHPIQMQGYLNLTEIPTYGGRNSISVVSDAAYPLPAEPVRREHRSSQMTMHQPRPQKQMSVASIEGEQQPFHQQIPPAPLAGHQASSEQTAYQSAPMNHTGQPTEARDTPLPNIPESAVNAQPFQPASIPHPQYYPFPMQQPMYYYPAPEGPQHGYGMSQMASPVYMQPANYYMPLAVPYSGPAEDNNQANTFMHESNGMVFFYDTTQGPGGNENMMGQAPPGVDGYYTPTQPGVMSYYPPPQ